MSNLADLLPYATPRQAEILAALTEHGTSAKAGEALGISSGQVRNAVGRARKRAAARGWSPDHDMTRTVPEGYHVRGVSTYYDQDGKPRGQWVKSQKSREEEWEAVVEALKDLTEPHAGKSTPVAAPTDCAEDLLALYAMGDPHLGMLAWKPETGNDFDLKIAEQVLVDCATRLVEAAPPAQTALLFNAGDFFHTDRSDNRTNASGHNLDVDSRLPKLFRVGARTMVELVDLAKKKHKIVRVLCAKGNHDEILSFALTMYLDAYYRNDPRVMVDTSPAVFYYYRFGEVLLGFHHGHTCKPKDLPGVMACDRRVDWGETRYHHWYTGHIHHDSSGEAPGCTWESLRTTAPGDAWHVAKGYRAGRDMKCDVWHTVKGRRGRIIESVG